MTFASVAVKNVGRNLFRTSLTIVGVAIAMLSFMLLRTVLSAWTAGAEHAAKDRIATRHKVTFVMTLPKRYVQDIRNLDSVKDVTWSNWFGARLPDHEDQFFANIATDPESFLRVYDEIEVPPEQKKAWFDNRKGALVGATLARQFGWKVGDRVTLAGTIFPGDWEFEIEGIYTASRKSIDQSTFWFHWDYLNESNVLPGAKDQVGWIVSRVDDAGAAARVSKQIDQLFETRDIQTLSMSERALNASFLGMLSTLLKAVDMVSIVILVIMMLILGNTIAMAVRERTREYGVLRAMGFLPGHIGTLIVAEAAALGLLGGVIGVGVSWPLVNQGLGQFIEDNFTAFFPYFRVAEGDVLVALAASAVGAALAAAVPAVQAARLDVVDALRRVA